MTLAELYERRAEEMTAIAEEVEQKVREQGWLALSDAYFFARERMLALSLELNFKAFAWNLRRRGFLISTGELIMLPGLGAGRYPKEEVEMIESADRFFCPN